MKKHERHEDMDYILEEIVGGIGWWQIRTTLLFMPIVFVGGYSLFLSVFTAYTPAHRCYIDNCDTPMSNLNESFLDFALSREKQKDTTFSSGAQFPQCTSYPRWDNGTENGTCSADDFDSSNTTKCSKFVYDHTQMSATIVTELDLVCDEAYKTKLFDVALIAGLFAGSIIGGWVGDKLGRKKSMILAILVIIPCEIIGGYSVNFTMYFILRFLSIGTMPVMWFSSMSYGLEYFSPQYRKGITALTYIPFSYFILGIVLLFVDDWTTLHWCVGILAALCLPSFYFLPESPRWLAGNNRVDEAEKIFLDIAKTNGRKLTEDQNFKLRQILENVELTTEESLLPWDMFTKNYLLRTLVLMLSWSTVSIGFYALSLNSAKLAGNIVRNYMFASLAECPAYLILFLLLDRIGRKKCMSLSQFILGTASLVLAFIPKDQSTYVLIAYMLGKLGGSMGFMMVYLTTAEVFPTNLRSQAMGLCSTTARIFTFCAPYLTSLSVYWVPLPMVVLGVPTLLAGCLVLLFLPESSGQDLPQNMKEGGELNEAVTLEEITHPHMHKHAKH